MTRAHHIGSMLLAAALVLALAAPARADDQKLFDFSTMATTAAQNKTDEVAAFVRRGDNPNFVDSQGRSPLDYAAGFGNLVMMQMLLDGGARPDYRDQFGATPLHWAAEAGHVEAIKLLLNAKAPVDATNKQGGTPLMMAAGANRGEAVKALLQAGADPKKQDFTGRDAMGYAAGKPGALRALQAARPG
jgi:uncharacterized protein